MKIFGIIYRNDRRIQRAACEDRHDIAYCGDKDNKIYQAFTLSLVYIFLTHTYYEVP